MLFEFCVAADANLSHNMDSKPQEHASFSPGQMLYERLYDRG